MSTLYREDARRKPIERKLDFAANLWTILWSLHYFGLSIIWFSSFNDGGLRGSRDIALDIAFVLAVIVIWTTTVFVGRGLLRGFSEAMRILKKRAGFSFDGIISGQTLWRCNACETAFYSDISEEYERCSACNSTFDK